MAVARIYYWGRPDKLRQELDRKDQKGQIRLLMSLRAGFWIQTARGKERKGRTVKERMRCDGSGVL